MTPCTISRNGPFASDFSAAAVRVCLQTSKAHHDDDACEEPRQPRTGSGEGMEAVAQQQQRSQRDEAQCCQSGPGGHKQGQA